MDLPPRYLTRGRGLACPSACGPRRVPTPQWPSSQPNQLSVSSCWPNTVRAPFRKQKFYVNCTEISQQSVTIPKGVFKTKFIQMKFYKNIGEIVQKYGSGYFIYSPINPSMGSHTHIQVIYTETFACLVHKTKFLFSYKLMKC